MKFEFVLDGKLEPIFREETRAFLKEYGMIRFLRSEVSQEVSNKFNKSGERLGKIISKQTAILKRLLDLERKVKNIEQGNETNITRII